MIFDLKNFTILATLVAWFFVAKKKEKWLPFVGVFLALSLATELSAVWLRDNGYSNALVYNMFIPIDYVLSGLILSRVGPGKPRSMKVLLYASPLFLLVAVIFLLSKSPLIWVASSVLLVSGLIVAIQSTVVLFTLAQMIDIPIMKHPGFWIALSPFFFFTCFVPSFGLAMYFGDTNSDLAMKLYNIMDYFFFLRYSLILIGLGLLLKGRFNVE